MRLISLALVCAILSSTSVGAQQPPRASARRPVRQASAAPMTNQDVLALVGADLSDEVILAKMSTAQATAFDTSAEALVKLKKAGVSERVIMAMLGIDRPHDAPSGRPSSAERTSRPAESRQPSTPAAVSVSVAPPDTTSIEGREAGIYAKGKEGFTPLEPTVFSGGKTKGVIPNILTMGLKKAKWTAVVRSPQAGRRIPAARPEFLFYFERAGSGLGNTGMMGALLGASSPNEFVLARMTKKKDERQLIVGEFGTLGASTGTRSRDTVDVAVERLAAGVYRVVPREPLAPGEYCFFYAAGATAFYSAGTGKLFDFGVDPPAP